MQQTTVETRFAIRPLLAIRLLLAILGHDQIEIPSPRAGETQWTTIASTRTASTRMAAPPVATCPDAVGDTPETRGFRACSRLVGACWRDNDVSFGMRNGIVTATAQA